MLDIGCTAKYLPNDMAVVSAETAIRQNPLNRPANNGPSAASGLILPPEHLAVLTSRYWGVKGVRLTVGFMEQTPSDLQKRILSHMNAWGEYSNVSFVLASDPQVRITRAQQGYWSYLGTDILHIAKSEPTMCLQEFTMKVSEAEFRRVVRHETGHTLGFPHEHMRRSIIDRIDHLKAIAYFRQTQGWSAAMVQQQVLTPLAESSIMGTRDADETSIMAYNLPGLITRDGRPIVGGSDIAPQDAEFVAKIYPKAPAPPPDPEPAVGKGVEFRIDPEKKRIGVRAESGWSVYKINSSGDIAMSCESFAALADELEGTLPPQGAERESAAQAPIGGVVGKVLELVAALRAGDLRSIIAATRDLLTILLGDDGSGETGINFAEQAAAAKLDWSKLIGVLVKLLPLLLGA